MPSGSRLLALLALLAAAMIVAAGCTAAPPADRTNTTTPTPATTYCAACEGVTTMDTLVPHAPFNGTVWEWRALELGADVIAVDDSANYTVVFTENGTYGITADCNVGGGDYAANGRSLNLSPPITTLIWCGEESQDRVYLASLVNASSYGFDGEGRLVLHLEAPGERMVFAARGPGAGPTVSASSASQT